MKRADQPADALKLLVGVRSLAAAHERDGLDAALHPERARCPLEAHGLQVPEQRVHRRRPIARGPADGVAPALDGAQASAEAHSPLGELLEALGDPGPQLVRARPRRVVHLGLGEDAVGRRA